MGSIRDTTFRAFLSERKLLESRKLTALMVASLGDPKGSRNLLQQYVEDLWYVGRLKKDKHQEMLDYYEQHVRHITPEVHVVRDRDGTEHVSVSGLEGLF